MAVESGFPLAAGEIDVMNGAKRGPARRWLLAFFTSAFGAMNLKRQTAASSRDFLSTLNSRFNQVCLLFEINRPVAPVGCA